MATTSPDNLFSPNPSDNYNLIADWATSMQSVQAALVQRANMYVGTSTQRTAFTSAPEGVHWQDTNGTKQEWVRQSNAWVATVDDTGWIAPTLPSGYTAENGLGYRVRGGVLYFRGRIRRTSGNIDFSVNFFTLPSDFRPSVYTRAATASYSGVGAPSTYMAISETTGAVSFGVMGAGTTGDVYLGGIAILLV